MMPDDREEYGEEAQDVIDGLRHLAGRVETPPALPSTILAHGAQFLPPEKEHRARWWTVVATWRPHPLAWGPVVAVAFFIAGVLAPWPRVKIPFKTEVYENPSAPAADLLPRESTEVSPVLPPMLSQPQRREIGPQTEPDPAPSDRLGALARRAPSQAVSSSHMKITASLPAALYEQLQQEAQRRQVSMAAILREAVEAYAQSHSRSH
jgi:Ribbon-helix-helix protein, copG family